MIKVTLGEKPKEENKFPKLMIADHNSGVDTGMIVLMNDNHCGTVIRSVIGSEKMVGDYLHGFYMPCFSEYTNTVTLQNA